MSDPIPSFSVRELKAFDATATGRAFQAVLVMKKLAAKTARTATRSSVPISATEPGRLAAQSSATVRCSKSSSTAGEGGVVRIEGEDRFLSRTVLASLASALRS
jgi:hypothetical protein